jgi:hypothetical protein
MSEVNVGINISLNDSASPALQRVEREATQSARKVAAATERETAKSARAATAATERAAQEAARASERGAALQRKSAARLAHAREIVGIRPEKAIQREIARTQGAYARLAASGKLSWNQQQRAADQMREKVTRLTNEMGKLTDRQKALGALKVGASLAAGAGAAAYTLKAPVERAMSFDERLAYMSLTAFSGRDKAGKKAGMKELEAAINKSVQEGGTREEAANALNTIIAADVVTADDAMAMLPGILRTQTATQASATDVAKIGIAAVQNMKINPKELDRVYNIAATGGQMGSFEMEHMAAYMPQMLASAANAGLSGTAGLAKTIALAQAAMKTAGDPAAAATNVANLLSKLNSQDSVLRAKALGINLEKEMVAGRAKGMDSLDVFNSLVDRVVENSPRYKQLQKQMASTENDEEKTALLEEMTKIAEGFAIGGILSDRQALMGLLAWRNDPEKNKAITQEALSGRGLVDENAEFIRETAAFEARRRGENSAIAEKAGAEHLTPIVREMSKLWSALASEFPLLTGATMLATTALTAFAATAGIATLAMGGKGLPGRLLDIGGNALSGFGGKTGGAWRGVVGSLQAAKATGSFLPSIATAGLGTSVAGLVAAGAVGYGIGTLVNMGIEKGIQAATDDKDWTMGSWIYDWWNKDKEAELLKDFAPPKPPPQPPVEVNTRLTVDLGNGLVAKNQNSQVTGGNARIDTGNIHSGAPP